MPSGFRRGKGIFDDARQGGVGHDKPALASAVEAVGKDAEGIGVALKVGDVVPEAVAHPGAQLLALALGEEGLYGFLATVAEGRVAQVVRQSGSLDDGANLLEERAPQFGMALGEDACHVVAERLAERRDFERVGQTVVDEDAAGQGEHLRLVLQTPEGRRVNETVAVALELRAVVMPLVPRLLSETLVGDKLLPIHSHKSSGKNPNYILLS